MKQRQYNTFAGGEANEWLKRNKNKVTADGDPVLHSLKLNKIEPKNLLEVGCADGWRLREIEKLYPQCQTTGVDPLLVKPHKNSFFGGAHDLNFLGNATFDVVVYGFCLYLCDRDDLFNIAKEGDRVLKDGGHIVVYDFHSTRPSKMPYKHHKGVFSYHFSYENLWNWNPAYSMATRQLYGTGNDTTEVVVLHKNSSIAWPDK